MDRYFIVIDDIWDTKTWEIVRCVFVHSNCASRIITTTHIHEVARKTGQVYRLEPLSHDLSEELFHIKLFGGKNKSPYDDQLAEVYNKILHKCGGVPLAIITMASLLVGKPAESWSKVYNSIGFGYEDNKDVDNTRKVLLFSYYDLPCQKKKNRIGPRVAPARATRVAAAPVLPPPPILLPRCLRRPKPPGQSSSRWLAAGHLYPSRLDF